MGRTSKAKLGTSAKPIIAYKNWFTFFAELSAIFTFLMVAIIFFTGIALAVKIAVSVDKAEVIIKELTKYVEKFIKLMKVEAEKVKVKIQAAEIPEHVKAEAGKIKQQSLQASKMASKQIGRRVPNQNQQTFAASQPAPCVSSSCNSEGLCSKNSGELPEFQNVQLMVTVKGDLSGSKNLAPVTIKVYPKLCPGDSGEVGSEAELLSKTLLDTIRDSGWDLRTNFNLPAKTWNKLPGYDEKFDTSRHIEYTFTKTRPDPVEFEFRPKFHNTTHASGAFGHYDHEVYLQCVYKTSQAEKGKWIFL